MGNIGLRIILMVILVVLMGFAVYLLFNAQTLKYLPISDPLLNPLMGWAPWATIKRSEQPHTLVYADLTWRDFEPQEGIFDFSSFETRNQFQRWRAEGKRVVFRFVLDKPGHEKHLDIPDWLFDKIDGDGDFYDHGYGEGFSPNYANPMLISSHQKAIQALGEHYGRDGFIAYIELGSLGHWGEWHIKSNTNIRPLPLEAIRNQYVEHYLQAFPSTHVLMRRPFNIAANNGLGLYNDMTGDLKATNTWLGWIVNGGEYSQTDELFALSPMRDGWQTAPVGGEQTHSVDDEEMYLENLDQTIDLLRASHTTFIGPGGAYDILEGGLLQSGVDRVVAVVGYRLFVKQLQLPRWVHYGNHLRLKLHFSNNGIEPMYYAWPVFIYLISENGEIHSQYNLGLDVSKILPGELVQVSFDLPIDQLENGKYTLGIAVLDPLTNQPVVRFAMPNSHKDLIQELGSFEVKRWF